MVGSKDGDASLKLPPLLKETGTERQVCTATIRAGILMLQNMGMENSAVGVTLMFSLFLSLQDNEAKSNKPKCSKSTGLKMCVKLESEFQKYAADCSFPPPVFLLCDCNFYKLLRAL